VNPFISIVLVLALAIPAIAAEDLGGIWTGVAPGKHGTKKDVAFRFKSKGGRLTGTLFGDEFDLPIHDGSLAGGKVQFSVTTTNYYSGIKVKFDYTGEITSDLMTVTVQRVLAPGEKPPEDENLKQTFTLKKLIP
jgi:hypothetical protein